MTIRSLFKVVAGALRILGIPVILKGYTFGTIIFILLRFLTMVTVTSRGDQASCNVPDMSMDKESMQPSHLRHIVGRGHGIINIFKHSDDNVDMKETVRKVRIVCYVPTGPNYFNTRVAAVKQTWGKKCDVLLFMTANSFPEVPTVALNITEGWGALTTKSMASFRYIFKNHFNDADWFMKVDDDTFVAIENLKYFLASKDTNKPVFYGHHFGISAVKQGYFGGGAGYVLSKEALRRFGKLKYNECREAGGAEDLEMGKCMEKLGVQIGVSLDAYNRSRFHTYSAENHVTGAYPMWLMDYDSFGLKKGVENISDYAVSFHYMKPHGLYEMDFFLYHFRPYGMKVQHNSM